MREAVEQRRCHLGVAEHARPFAEGQVGGDEDGGALVKPADQVEQQLATGLGEWQVAQFVEHDEVEPRQVIGEPALPTGAGFALQPIDEVDDGVEASSRSAADASSSDRYGEMALAGAGAADQNGVALPGKKGAACQIADQ